jgi:hypothetical protein
MALPASVYFTNDSTLAAKPRRLTVHESHAERDTQRDHQARMKRKIEQTNRMLDALERRELRLAGEIKRLQSMKAATKARYEQIEDRAILEMQGARLQSAAGIRTTFTLRAAAPSLIVDNEDAIPRQFFIEKIVTSVDKVAVKQALAHAQEVPGVHLESKISLLRK